MTAGILEDRDQQRASVRAQAAAIADAPRPPRRYANPAGAVLRPSPRQRQGVRPAKPVAERRSIVPRRVVAALILLAQVALLVLALTLPAFQVQHVTISGERLLSAQDITSAASVPQQSIFTVDAESIRHRLLALPWVQEAAVSTELPATVRIAVTERTPAVRIRRLGVDTFIAENGASLAATPRLEKLWASTPALIDERTGSAQAIDPRLLNIMRVTAQRFPKVFGVKVAAFEWGVDNVFVIWTSSGWKAILGHMDTGEALAAVPAQLSALGSVTPQLSVASPDFGYVDLENVAAPAVGGSPGLPPEVLAINSAPQPVQPAPPYTPPAATPGAQPGASSAPTLKPVSSTQATPAASQSPSPTPPLPAGQTPPTTG